MMLYNAPDPAPNPRRVRIFLAEKGVEIPTTDLSIPASEHRSEAFLARNSLGQLPALELDDGTVIAESISICRYFEDLFPEPSLFGHTPLERATIDMWLRRVEFVLMGPVGMVWLHVHPFTAALGTQYKYFGEASRARARNALEWFDAVLAERNYLAGKYFSIADIVLLTTIDFAHFIRLGMPQSLMNLDSWYRRVAARPSTSTC